MHASTIATATIRTKAANATIHIAVAVRSNNQCAWPGESLFHHDLMSNTSSSGVELYSMVLRELLDLTVLLEVLL